MSKCIDFDLYEGNIKSGLSIRNDLWLRFGKSKNKVNWDTRHQSSVKYKKHTNHIFNSNQ